MSDPLSKLGLKYAKILGETANPRYVYRIFDVESCPLLVGNDIIKHVEGCSQIVLLCATLGERLDRAIRAAQISDMAGAVILDSLASDYIEQVLDTCEDEIRAKFPNKTLTWRYSPGYGDFPISVQPEFLSALDAGRKIGLYCGESLLLTPQKSVTAVIGLS
ncbi:hypothetical protein FACS189490_00730 [Clostridia bacterium]|nr:hypothetical protein FACS189490_00730 [Clostridia bacterium]